MEKSFIINEQYERVWSGKGWREKLFYVFSGNIIVECKFLYQDNGINHYEPYPKDYGTPIHRIIAKNKVQLVDGTLIYPSKNQNFKTKNI